MKPWILLDRDGVINHDSEAYVKSAKEWIPIDGSLEAIAMMNQKGFSIAVATNQSGIGRGYYTEQDLHDMHQKMHDLLAEYGGFITTVQYCPHIPTDLCDCRKPKPGMLQAISNTHGFELAGVPFVGDSLRDLKAAQKVGCKPVLVKTGYGEQTLQNLDQSLKHIDVVDNLWTFANNLPTLNTSTA